MTVRLNFCILLALVLVKCVQCSGDRESYIHNRRSIGLTKRSRFTPAPTIKSTQDACIGKTLNSSLNVARGKSVTLSSIFTRTSPGSLMVDGDRNSSWPCACTAASRRPYAVIDLLEKYNIHMIYIVNRGDCCSHRLHDLVVYVGNDTSSMSLVARHNTAIGATCTLELDRPVCARYVKLQIEGDASEYLTICELEIY